jgi:hypothetical protein
MGENNNLFSFNEDFHGNENQRNNRKKETHSR